MANLDINTSGIGSVELVATGTESNISVNITPKGTGGVTIGGNPIGSLVIQEEGVEVLSGVTTLDFVGSSVTATSTGGSPAGNDVTITIAAAAVNNWLTANNSADFTVAPVASSVNAIAIGASASATDSSSIAVGTGASSGLTGCVAIGESASTIRPSSVVIGRNATDAAYGGAGQNVVIGNDASVGAGYNTGSVVIGKSASNAAFKDRCVVVGYASTASETNQTTIGPYITALDVPVDVAYSLKIGCGMDTERNLIHLHSKGHLELVGTDAQVVVPNYATASEPANPVSGSLIYDSTLDALKTYDGAAWNSVGGSSGITIQEEGVEVLAGVTTLDFVGSSVTATSTGGSPAGNDVTITISAATVNNWLLANNDSDFATSPISTGANSIALGNGTTTSTSTNSIAFGSSASTTGNESVTIGLSATNQGTQCIVIGKSANSSNNSNNIAIGSSATASSGRNDSIAIGRISTASNSIAIGTNVTASGNNSIAIGKSPTTGLIAQGSRDTVMGYQSQSLSGTNDTILIGNSSTTNKTHQVVIGNSIKFDSVSGDPAYSVKLGNMDGANSNLIYLHDKGKLELLGDEAQIIVPSYTSLALFGSPTLTGVEGGLVYDSTSKAVKFNNGNAWIDIGDGIYEIADPTILKDIDIGVNIAAQTHTHTKLDITDFSDGDYLSLGGGTLSGDLKLNNSVKLLLGTASNFEILHDGNAGVFNNLYGVTYFFNKGGLRITFDDAGTKLYDSLQGERLATTTSGININGTLSATDTVTGTQYVSTTLALAPFVVSSAITVNNLNADLLDNVHGSQFLRSDVADVKTTGNLTFNDNVILKLGTGGDLSIYHNGTNSYIDSITGTVIFRSAGSDRISFSAAGTYIYDNASVQRIHVSTTGVSITGNLVSSDGVYSTNSRFAGSGVVDSNCHLDSPEGTGGVYLNYYGGAGGTIFGNGALSIVARVSSSGVFTGTGVVILDNAHVLIGSSSDLDIYHDGVNTSYINATSGHSLQIRSGSESMIRCNGDAGVLLYYNGNERLVTTLAGIDSYGVLTTDGIVRSTAAQPFGAGVLGYTDTNSGFIFRPPQAGAAWAYEFRTFGNSSVLNINNNLSAYFYGNVTAPSFTSTVTTGTAPFTVASMTLVSNLNAALLGGYLPDAAANANTIARRDAGGNLFANRFLSSVATGSSPFDVVSTTLNTNLNADMLDGYHASDFAQATYLGNYLPLTGGTLTGNLTTSSAAPAIVVNATSGTNSATLRVANAVDNKGFDLRLTGYGSVELKRVDAAGAGIAGQEIFTTTTDEAQLSFYKVPQSLGAPTVASDLTRKDYVDTFLPLAGGTLTGNVTITGNVSATNFVGTLSTAAQPNITSVGTLTGLTVSSDISVTGIVYGSSFKSNGAVNTNCHLDSPEGTGAVYLNYSGGTGGVAFGNGANGYSAAVTSSGVFTGAGVDMPDNAHIYLGFSGDIDIYHDGTVNNYFNIPDGQVLRIQAPSTRYITCVGGLVELYKGNNIKLSTTDTGIGVTGNVTATTLQSTATTGTAPLTVASTTLVPNLNADLLDGYHAATAATANTMALRDANGNLTAASPTADGHLVTRAYVNSAAFLPLTGGTTTGDVIVNNSNVGGDCFLSIEQADTAYTNLSSTSTLYLPSTGARYNSAKIQSDHSNGTTANHAQDLVFYNVIATGTVTERLRLHNNGTSYFTGDLTVSGAISGALESNLVDGDALQTAIGTYTSVLVSASQVASLSDGYYMLRESSTTGNLEYEINWNGTWITKFTIAISSSLPDMLWITAGGARIKNNGGVGVNLQHQRLIG